MRSFTARLTLRFAVLVTLTTASVLAFGGWLLDRQMVRALELLHGVEFAEVLGFFDQPQPPTQEEITRAMSREAEGDAALYFFQVHDKEGRVVFRSPSLGEAMLPIMSGATDHWTASVPGIGDVRISEFAVRGWHLQVASALEPLRRLLREYARVAGVLLLLVGIASVGLGYGFSRFTLRPVRAIEQTARRIGGNNLEERIPQPSGHDELADLVRLLNEMFDRLEASFAQVKRFTADASHELKTPLALLRLNAEKLRSTCGEGLAGEQIGEMLEDIEALRRMVESLLLIAKLESGGFAPALSEVEAEAFVRGFAEDAAAIAEDGGARFVLERADAGVVRCEATLMRQVLLNLLNNALRFTPAGGTIALASTLVDGTWRLEMTDEGPGVPAGQLERIFERFVRIAPESETAAAPAGHGLGLAICRSIVGLHGGTIQASNRAGRRGLRVRVELPGAPRAEG